MGDKESLGFLPVMKRCERCGLEGYHIENGLCLDCIEAELKRGINFVPPSPNGNNTLREGLKGG